jgi:hypothetical protein
VQQKNNAKVQLTSAKLSKTLFKQLFKLLIYKLPQQVKFDRKGLRIKFKIILILFNA